MKLTFFGAAREVTGSCTLIETGKSRVLVDCGLFQGSGDSMKRNWQPFPFDPRSLDAVIITHAHIDHIGRFPRLVQAGFKGRAFVTHPTRHLAKHMWMDAAKVMKEEGRRHQMPPLYETADIWPAYDCLHGVEYGTQAAAAEDLHFTFRDAGHIFGSAFVEIEADGRRVVFSGDVGNDGVPILRDTEAISFKQPDAVVLESTYGDRKHEDVRKRVKLLRQAISETVGRGGVLLIPAFSLERTQEILYELNGLVEASQLPRVKIFLDSPLAINIMPVYRRFAEYYDKEAATLARKDDFFDFPGLVETRRQKDSLLIKQIPAPKVIIAGSGMMNGGRVLRHLADYLGDPRNMVLVVGFQAEGTLGREICEGAKKVVVDKRMVEVKARIREIHAYSAHADAEKLADWAGAARPKTVILNHGEPGPQDALAAKFMKGGIAAVKTPAFGETVEI